MSSQEQFQSSGGAPPPVAQKDPVCPQCNHGMIVKQVAPVLFASHLDDVIYGCAACGTEAKRTIKRT